MPSAPTVQFLERRANGPRAERFRARGPVVARERFSRDAAADAFDRLFSAVIDRHRPGARTEPAR